MVDLFSNDKHYNMKKNTLIILITLCFIFFKQFKANSQCSDFDWEEQPNGKIKVVTYKCYIPNENDFFLNSMQRFFYNDKKNIVKILFYNNLDSSTLTKSQIYYYNMGKLIELDYFDKNNKLFSKIIFKYNKKGDKVEEIRTHDTVNTTTKFKYDKKGNQIEQGFYSTKNGKLYSVVNFNYDSRGNNIKEERRSVTKNILNSYTFKYDDKKNLIETIQYQKGEYQNLTKKWSFKYNAENKKIQEIITDSGFYSRFTYSYDINNTIIEKCNYGSDGSLFSKILYQIQYDKFKNWRLITSIDNNNKVIFFAKREIEYY